MSSPVIPRGTVGFSTSQKLASRIIRSETGSRISHTFMVVDQYGSRAAMSPKGVLTFEASHWTVHFGTYAAYHDKPEKQVQLWAPLPTCITEEQVNQAFDYLVEFNEEAYGFLQIIGHWFTIQCRKMGLPAKRNPIGNGIVCSELMLLYLQLLNVPGADNLDRDTVTPEDVRQLVMSCGWFTPISLPGFN